MISAGLLATVACQPLQAAERPNIIVFLVDDMGLMDTSLPFLTNDKGEAVKHPLNKWYRTPNMERLAEKGIRFSQFYACTVSSPSRCSILTGQNSARHHTTQWIDQRRNNKGKFGPAHWNWLGLDHHAPTLPSLLREEGYKTLHVGKAHFGPRDYEGENPLNLGFDVNVAGGAMGRPNSYYGEKHYGWMSKNKDCAIPGLEAYWDTDTFLTEALTLEAIKNMDTCVDQDNPFFLYFGQYALHGPFDTDPRFKSHYEGRGQNKKVVGFSTLVEGMDKSLGDVLDYLDKKGIAENTLIFFLGDNGSDSPMGNANNIASSAPLRGKKGSRWEGGTRVPFIAAWAKSNPQNKWQKRLPIATNQIQTQMGVLYDIYPTVLDMLNISQPKKWTVDGQNLKKLLAGKRDKKHESSFLSNFPHEHRNDYFTTYREGDWKIMYNYFPTKDQAPVELYNLKEDPSESHNLCATNPKRALAMLKKLRKEMKRMGGQTPEVDRKALDISLSHIQSNK